MFGTFGLSSDARLIELEKNLVDCVGVLAVEIDEMPHNEVCLASVRKRVPRAADEAGRFVRAEAQRHGRGDRRGLFGLVVEIAADFAEMLAIGVRALADLGIRHAALVNHAQWGTGEGFFRLDGSRGRHKSVLRQPRERGGCSIGRGCGSGKESRL